MVNLAEEFLGICPNFGDVILLVDYIFSHELWAFHV